ncbi:MAG: CRTAC1 family protein [Balneolaceae bacterium]|nr:CRTAC1 family protein [Balneolaceae bacterium]
MDNQKTNSGSLSPKVKILGTLFLFAQLLLAVNNYGPHRIPLLNLLFNEPWVHTEEIDTQTAEIRNSETFTFEDITMQAGLDSFYRANVNSSNPSYLEVMGGGLAVADVDGDGYEDIFFASMPSFSNDEDQEVSPPTLFQNRGDGTFRDITEEAGLRDIEGYPQGALFFDYNNSGRPDLYVTSYNGGQLFRNVGGIFTDVTDSAGLNLEGLCGEHPCFGSSTAAADYNRDGHLDLVIINNVDWDIDNSDLYGEHQLFPAFFEAQESLLFQNDGDGTFTDVTRVSGLINEGGKGLSAVWSDVNNDGWPDLYISNDLTRNHLYLNNRDGTFMEMGAAARVNEVKSSMGTTASDFNGDGDIDLVTTNLEGSMLSLFKNLGDLRYEYATTYTGLNPSRRSSGWGVEFTDFNRDGYADLVMAAGPVWDENPKDDENLFFQNRGDGSFKDVTRSVGNFPNNGVSRGIAVMDVQNDGRPDLVISNIDGGRPQLLSNTTQNNHHWLKLTLEGTVSNRDAIGARATLVRTDGHTIDQEVRAGGSYQSSGTKSLYFGMADSDVRQLTIRWPSGHRQTLEEVPVDTALHVMEERIELSGKMDN